MRWQGRVGPWTREQPAARDRFSLQVFPGVTLPPSHWLFSRDKRALAIIPMGNTPVSPTLLRPVHIMFPSRGHLATARSPCLSLGCKIAICIVPLCTLVQSNTIGATRKDDITFNIPRLFILSCHIIIRERGNARAISLLYTGINYWLLRFASECLLIFSPR